MVEIKLGNINLENDKREISVKELLSQVIKFGTSEGMPQGTSTADIIELAAIYTELQKAEDILFLTSAQYAFLKQRMQRFSWKIFDIYIAQWVDQFLKLE